jgi:hypothetical protein
MLQPGEIGNVVDASRLVLVEKLAGSIKLHKVASQRPAHKSLPLKNVIEGKRASNYAPARVN